MKKTIYLKQKSGDEITAEQNRLNALENTRVIASQVFLIELDNRYCYDAFIYLEIFEIKAPKQQPEPVKTSKFNASVIGE